MHFAHANHLFYWRLSHDLAGANTFNKQSMADFFLTAQSNVWCYLSNADLLNVGANPTLVQGQATEARQDRRALDSGPAGCHGNECTTAITGDAKISVYFCLFCLCTCALLAPKHQGYMQLSVQHCDDCTKVDMNTSNK